MQKWFQKELEERGFSKYKKRRAYGCRFVNEVEFYVRLINSKVEKDEWYPEFGVNIPYPFGTSDGMEVIGLSFNHICRGEIIENDSSSDVWTEKTKEELLNVLDNTIVPWIDRYSNLEDLIGHYLERIERGIPVLPHKRYELDTIRSEQANVGDPGAELVGMLISNSPPPAAAQKFWEYVAILYRQLGKMDSARESIENYLKFTKEKYPNPIKGSFPEQVIDKVEAVLEEGKWLSA
jgi:hypothetical protein